jgi:hypothetical protein
MFCGAKVGKSLLVEMTRAGHRARRAWRKAQLQDRDFYSSFSCFRELRFIEHRATSTFEIRYWIFDIPFFLFEY